MASLRDIRVRIGSVKSTRQITSAMKMVAAAKLRRATDAATQARPYAQTLAATLKRVAAGAGDVEHPLLESRAHVKKIAVVVIGSERGLCGGFNANRDRKIEEWMKGLRDQGREIKLRTYGKKATNFFKGRNWNPEPVLEITAARFGELVDDLSTWLSDAFVAGEIDEAWLCFNMFKNVMTQTPTMTKVLPLSLQGGEESNTSYIYEPDAAGMIATLLPLYLRTLLLQSFLENEAGFFASQMTAMDSATRNASDLIDRLTLEYNRSRQAAITKELIEIISGAEAL